MLTAVEMLNELIRQGHVVPVAPSSADFIMPSAYRPIDSATSYGTGDSGARVERANAELDGHTQRDQRD